MRCRTRHTIYGVGACVLGAAAIGVTSALADLGDSGSTNVKDKIECEFVPNGQFNRTVPGPDGVLLPDLWATAPSLGGFGDFEAVPTIEVVDIGPPYDNALALSTYSFSRFSDYWPAGSAASAKSMVRVDVDYMPYTNLVFDVAGGQFHGIMFDTGDIGYSVSIVIENGTTGERFREEVFGYQFGLCEGWGCGNGVALYGAFFPETVCIELAEEGFSAGDVLKVFFIFQSNATALGECDEFSEFIGTIFIDNVRFCDGCDTEDKSPDELSVSMEQESLDTVP